MSKETFLGILKVHGANIIIEGKNQEDVEAEVEDEIAKANKKFPNYDFHDRVEIFEAHRVKKIRHDRNPKE